MFELKKKISLNSTNQKGQAFLEAILYLLIIGIVFSLLSKTFKESQLISKVIDGPWVLLSGMIQNGSWGSIHSTLEKHPNHDRYHKTSRPN